ncbi:hypothetical protein [Variovorax sp. PBL-E5]|uniref:hypothetical protein n=1 Tax=Variovorax sp. PBL-E5 TaxID=434014 RepID=UPI001319B597|nr:hypothetical protein [Variovorax sp. PBL-E5]VTU28469.1 hypothetical protein E5CHR_02615 [Variovorax sp. PBL-E5]
MATQKSTQPAPASSVTQSTNPQRQFLSRPCSGKIRSRLYPLTLRRDLEAAAVQLEAALGTSESCQRMLVHMAFSQVKQLSSDLSYCPINAANNEEFLDCFPEIVACLHGAIALARGGAVDTPAQLYLGLTRLGRARKALRTLVDQVTDQSGHEHRIAAALNRTRGAGLASLSAGNSMP